MGQTFPRQERWDPRRTDLRDPVLTSEGTVQALEARATLNDVEGKCDVVLCSPLTRTAMTAVLAFGDSSAPIIALPALREFPRPGRRKSLSGLEGAVPQQCECVGRPMEEIFASCAGPLQADWAQRVDWSEASHTWWSEFEEEPIDLDQRLRTATKRILSLGVDRIGIVAHFNFLSRLTRNKRMLENC